MESGYGEAEDEIQPISNRTSIISLDQITDSHRSQDRHPPDPNCIVRRMLPNPKAFLLSSQSFVSTSPRFTYHVLPSNPKPCIASFIRTPLFVSSKYTDFTGSRLCKTRLTTRYTVFPTPSHRVEYLLSSSDDYFSSTYIVYELSEVISNISLEFRVSNIKR